MKSNQWKFDNNKIMIKDRKPLGMSDPNYAIADRDAEKCEK